MFISDFVKTNVDLVVEVNEIWGVVYVICDEHQERPVDCVSMNNNGCLSLTEWDFLKAKITAKLKHRVLDCLSFGLGFNGSRCCDTENIGHVVQREL